MKEKMKVGIVGIGLDVYWAQFCGLKEALEKNLSALAARLERDWCAVKNFGLIDNAESAAQTAETMRRECIDILFLHTSTYALSSTVLPVAKRCGAPIVVLNMQPDAGIDYKKLNSMADRSAMTGEWLRHCSACPAPEIANVFKRCKIPFREVVGYINGDAHAARETAEWLDAARAVYAMRRNRLGLLGHYYGGMLDIYTDLTLQLASFGGHIELLEMEELASLRREVSAAAIKRKMREFEDNFEITPDCPEAELERAAKTAAALDMLAEKKQLGSLAYYYMGTACAEHADIAASVILGNSLLTAAGVPVAGEYEVKNVQAMKILSALGAGGSFTEYVAADFEADVVLLGHDGPGHVAIAEGKPKVRPLEKYHGKIGSGLSIEMSVRHGDVTLLSVAERDGGLLLLHAEGRSVAGDILEIGNTNSRYKFALGARNFIAAWNRCGPAHHCAVGVGRVSSKIEKFASLLGIESLKIC